MIIWEESKKKSYNFNINKINNDVLFKTNEKLFVTDEQLKYEFYHLLNKNKNNLKEFTKNLNYFNIDNCIKENILFNIIPGNIMNFEKIKQETIDFMIFFSKY